MSEENMIEPENEEFENEEFDDEESLEEPIKDELEEPKYENRNPDIHRADSYNRLNRNGLNSRRQKNLNSPKPGNRINRRNNNNISNRKINNSSNTNSNYNKLSQNSKNGISSLFGSKKDGEFTIKLPVKTKIIFVVLLISIPFVLLMFVIVILGGNEHGNAAGGGTGSYTYGKTCASITVTNTGCDENGENCTNQYDGDVELEEYVAGVVAAEVGDTNNLEYYKVAAITARTHLLSNADDDCTIEGNATQQAYMNVDDSSNADLIRQAVQETEDLVIVKDEELIDTKSDSGINKSEALNLITNENYGYEEIIKHYYGNEVEIKKNEMKLSGIDGFVNPTRYIYCTSPYGNRLHPVKKTPQFHNGLDIAIPGGEPIYAANDGVITVVRNNVTAINNCDYSYGNYIIIDHGNGAATLYAHMKYGSIPDHIEVGAEVSQGEQIGQVGSTGCSTGNHLHYEVRLNGANVDPADYIDLTGAGGECRR